MPESETTGILSKLPENAVRHTMPYTEACMFLEVAGRPCWAAKTTPFAAQLYTDNGDRLSSPLLLAEAGLDQNGRPKLIAPGDFRNPIARLTLRPEEPGDTASVIALSRQLTHAGWECALERAGGRLSLAAYRRTASIREAQATLPDPAARGELTLLAPDAERQGTRPTSRRDRRDTPVERPARPGG